MLGLLTPCPGVGDMKAGVVLLLETHCLSAETGVGTGLPTEGGRRRTCPGGCARVETPTLGKARGHWRKDHLQEMPDPGSFPHTYKREELLQML